MTKYKERMFEFWLLLALWAEAPSGKKAEKLADEIDAYMKKNFKVKE